MNKRFATYLESLTPKKRDLAKEAVSEFLAGESEGIDKVCAASEVFRICRDLSTEDVEHAEVLLLNLNSKLIKRVRICTGGLTETFFDMRVVLREALLNNATRIIMVHNHPSGSLRPSAHDDRLTEEANKACKVMRIYLDDHVIIGGTNYYSYRENGKL